MTVAAENGNTDARERMPMVESELTAAQIIDAQKLALRLGRR
jgi:hypothetical protein